MSIPREVAIAAMKATELMAGNDFLKRAGVATPVPNVAGALPAVAREPFEARSLKKLVDLLVIFSIGDFPQSLGCSNYFNPNSPWYNVFYGAYGLRSHKPGGVPWGFLADGRPDLAEILEIPFTDYNFLTAGELGCPPDRMCFRTDEVTPSSYKGWEALDVRATVPSGLHRRSESVDPNLEYYAVFGVPPESLLVGGRASYEPVKMRGQMFFKVVGPALTLVWGGMCPDTPSGGALLDQIISAMKPLYAP